MSEKQYLFLEAQGDAVRANRAFTDEIGDAEEYSAQLPDEAGTPHPVWRCTQKQATKLWKSRTSTQASFIVWASASPNGPIHRIDFNPRRRVTCKPVRIGVFPQLAVTK